MFELFTEYLIADEIEPIDSANWMATKIFEDVDLLNIRFCDRLQARSVECRFHTSVVDLILPSHG